MADSGKIGDLMSKAGKVVEVVSLLLHFYMAVVCHILYYSLADCLAYFGKDVHSLIGNLIDGYPVAGMIYCQVSFGMAIVGIDFDINFDRSLMVVDSFDVNIVDDFGFDSASSADSFDLVGNLIDFADSFDSWIDSVDYHNFHFLSDSSHFSDHSLIALDLDFAVGFPSFDSYFHMTAFHYKSHSRNYFERRRMPDYFVDLTAYWICQHKFEVYKHHQEHYMIEIDYTSDIDWIDCLGLIAFVAAMGLYCFGCTGCLSSAASFGHQTD